MSNASTNQFVEKLKAEIEKQLNWGESSNWGSYDFEKLSEQISDKTAVMLSVTTLKRIFGKASYQSEPSITTLNALARFAGYTDFREFAAKKSQEYVSFETPKGKRFRITISATALIRIVLVLLLLTSLLILGFALFKKKPELKTADFNFSSKTILTSGLPNSVIFDYDASKATETDSVFISQSWDLRRKMLVNRNDKHFSSIYYYPGYYRAKLIVGNKIVKEHDLQIKTDGWLGVIAADWNVEPIYFRKAEIECSDGAEVSQALLAKYHQHMTSRPPVVYLFNQKESIGETGVYSDNFTFETEVKTEVLDSTHICQIIEIGLIAKNDAMIVPLITPACVGEDFSVMAFGYQARSRFENLSGFGCNVNEWTNLRVESATGLLSFFINGKKIYEAKLKNPPTEIVGVQVGFRGPGAVRNTRLVNAHGMVQF